MKTQHTETQAKRLRRRNIEIWRDRYGGRTLTGIGAKHGISRERVRQIVFRIDRDLTIMGRGDDG